MPVRVREVLRDSRHGYAACSVAYEEGSFHVNVFGGEVVVLQDLVPHAGPRLPEVVEGCCGVDASRNVQVAEHKVDLALPFL